MIISFFIKNSGISILLFMWFRLQKFWLILFYEYIIIHRKWKINAKNNIKIIISDKKMDFIEEKVVGNEL